MSKYRCSNCNRMRATGNLVYFPTIATKDPNRAICKGCLKLIKSLGCQSLKQAWRHKGNTRRRTLYEALIEENN